MIRFLLIALLAALMAAAPARAERDAVRAYMFGNSLVYHLGDPAHETAAPYWAGVLARAAGKDYAVNGQWGFLRNFARDLPPMPNWSFPDTADAWRDRGAGFGAQGIDAVVIAPANFIQFRNPDIPYDDEGPDGVSPLSAILTVFDHVREAEPDARLYLYEGWADMLPITGAFPPDAAAHARYLDANAGAHPAWYDRLERDLARTRPDMPVARIPVSRALAALVGEGGVLESLPAQALYTDGAPHGTPTLYLLAGAITYATLFDADVPENWTPPDSINPRVRDAWPEVARAISALRPVPVAPPAAPAETREAAEALPGRAEIPVPPPGMQPAAIPALGLGLAGIADWSTQHPFLDLMKSARPFVGHTEAGWGRASNDALAAGGYLDPDGWPLSVPEGVSRLETVILVDMPDDAAYLRGDYILTYEGQGDVTMTGRAERVRAEPGRIVFSYEPGPGVLGFAVDAVDPGDPVRDIRIVRADMAQLLDAGAVFNPEWLARVEDVRVLRFMDWMQTNDSLVQGWEDRPRVTDATWAKWGVPVEVMVDLANRIGIDPWFTMPHMADDDYVRRFAEAVRDGLDPDLKAYVEYSNEVWNFIFAQASWAQARARDMWGEQGDGWMQFYGMRAAQVAGIWSDVFGADADARLVRVVATHTGWLGLEEAILDGALAQEALGARPADSFDAYAVTGYFGHELASEEMWPTVKGWLDAAAARAETDGQAEGLSRVALREFAEARRFDGIFTPMTEALLQGSLRDLVEDVFPYHAGIADEYGLRLVMYEGGSHIAPTGDMLNNTRLTDLISAHAYTPEMARLYEVLLSGWVAAGGTLFNAYVDVAPLSRWGNWGGLRHLGDANVRWDMLMAYNATGPADWEPRDPAAFSGGVILRANAGGGTLRGTANPDVLAGGPGDDRLEPAGGDDRVGGGGGTDTVVLPGAPAAWRLSAAEDAIVAISGRDRVLLRDVEFLAFEGAPGLPPVPLILD